jgi:hypothetical protein
MIRTPWTVLCTLVAAGWLATDASPSRAEWLSLQKTDHGMKVLADGKLFAEYRTDIGTKPVLWPIIGPTGAEMTRNYPMKDVEGEKRDHYHQQSFWFTYGEVNDLDFWAEPRSYKDGKGPAGKKYGTIVEREVVSVGSSASSSQASNQAEAQFVTRNDWIDAQTKKRQLEDERVYRFLSGNNVRMIDFTITLKASDGDVHFGDTKEGAMGIRIPTVMDVNSKKGGRIENSEGQTDDSAWGQPARWVDYTGTLDGKPVGIAILNHPSSFHYPSRWHVRTYGLFAANPFGLHDFDKQAKEPGGYKLPAGESLTLSYRFVFHTGDTKAADIAKAFEAYAKEPAVKAPADK